jgi:hypothetical protein
MSNKIRFVQIYSKACNSSFISPLPVIINSVYFDDKITLYLNVDKLNHKYEWEPFLSSLKFDTEFEEIHFWTNFSHDNKTSKRNNQESRFLCDDKNNLEFAKSLKQCILNTSNLTTLELSGIKFTSLSLKVISSAISESLIRRVSFSRSLIGDEGLIILSNAFKFSKTLFLLNLSDCDLTSRSGPIIGEIIKYQYVTRSALKWMDSLRQNKSRINANAIKRLNLCNNSLGNEGLVYILEAICEPIGIQAIDLQFNGITKDMIDLIENVLRKNSQLFILDIRNNFSPSFSTSVSDLMLDNVHKHCPSNTRQDLQLENIQNLLNDPDLELLNASNPLAESHHAQEWKVKKCLVTRTDSGLNNSIKKKKKNKKKTLSGDPKKTQKALEDRISSLEEKVQMLSLQNKQNQPVNLESLVDIIEKSLTAFHSILGSEIQK